MGYESKLFIGERHEMNFPNGMHDVCFRQVAEYDLSKMGDSHFYNVNSFLFKTPIDFDLYVNRMVEELDYNKNNGQTKGWFESTVRDDGYGRTCCYAPIEEVLNYLKEWESKNEYYRRVPPLIAMLESFVEQQKWGAFENLVVVHYGH